MFLQPLSWFFEWRSSTHADWCLINIPSFPRDPDSQGSSVSFQISLVPFISSTHAPSYYFPSYSLCIITFCGRLPNWCIWEGHFLPCLILCESLVKSSSPPAQPGLSVLPELPTNPENCFHLVLPLETSSTSSLFLMMLPPIAEK